MSTFVFVCLKFKLRFYPNFRFLFTWHFFFTVHWIYHYVFTEQNPPNGHPPARLDHSASQRATIMSNSSLEKLWLLASLLAGSNRRQEGRWHSILDLLWWIHCKKILKRHLNSWLGHWTAVRVASEILLVRRSYDLWFKSMKSFLNVWW